jgi:hypothetical protein
MAPNRFVFKHHQIEVDYTLSNIHGSPALVYRDGNSRPRTFGSAEIKTDQTGLGILVWVALETSIDTGREKFAFFIPRSEVPIGESHEIRTVAVYQRSSGHDSRLPGSIPREPSWRCIELQGTAQNMIADI